MLKVIWRITFHLRDALPHELNDWAHRGIELNEIPLILLMLSTPTHRPPTVVIYYFLLDCNRPCRSNAISTVRRVGCFSLIPVEFEKTILTSSLLLELLPCPFSLPAHVRPMIFTWSSYCWYHADTTYWCLLPTILPSSYSLTFKGTVTVLLMPCDPCQPIVSFSLISDRDP